MEEILKRIPQRKPFLYLDKIIDQTDNSIQTQYHVSGEEDFFKGHFPDNPVMPGVILCEASFQSGALLMSYVLEGEITQKLAVVTRIQSAKFKKIVKPGDTIVMNTILEEHIENAAFMKTKVTVDGKLALTISFACAVVDG